MPRGRVRPADESPSEGPGPQPQQYLEPELHARLPRSRPRGQDPCPPLERRCAVKPPFDWNDPETIRRFLVEIRVAVDDIDGVVLDMFTKKRRRSLGRAQHKQLYREARRTLIQILEHLMPPPPPAAGAVPPH